MFILFLQGGLCRVVIDCLIWLVGDDLGRRQILGDILVRRLYRGRLLNWFGIRKIHCRIGGRVRKLGRGRSSGSGIMEMMMARMMPDAFLDTWTDLPTCTGGNL